MTTEPLLPSVASASALRGARNLPGRMGGPNIYRLTSWSKPTYMRSGRSLTGKLSRGVSIAAVLLLSVIALAGQSVPKARSAGSSLREHYDAAQALQEKGDLMQAAFQYK